MAEPAVAAAPAREPPRRSTRPPLRAVGPARAAPAGIPPAVGRLNLAPTSGAPLPRTIAGPVAASLGVDVSPVRVHADETAAAAADAVGARAFALGSGVFLGRGERPTDLPLMAHEVAHVVQQQGAPALQRWSRGGSDRFESEAHRASAAVVQGTSFSVRERTAPRVQRLGLSDALDYFADKANLIPGFRMFTIVLGVNPVNMSRVERSAANIMRAVVEFIPGGGLIVQALDNYGVFDKVGAWVDEQLRSLGMTGAAIKNAVTAFLDSLSWTDIFDLGGVWERAKKIFTEPIRRIVDFASGLVTGILKFIKDAILRPLAGLAEGTRGWNLLIAVLGKNPITGDAVPRSAETLIGGFMKLIGQEDVWENMKKANAVSRAWAWFQGALEGLLGFVREIPELFVSTLQSLEIADIVLLPRAFAKVGKVFLGFLGRFIGWAGDTVWKLLEIVFDAVSPGAWGYIKKTGAALKGILKNPLPFVGNLVKAAKLGFQNFASNFLEHLKKGLLDWLTGSLPGVYIPKGFALGEIVKFVFSVLGITWENVRMKLVATVGETAVKAMEAGFDIVVTLVKQGPAAAWDKIKEQLSSLKDQVIGGIIDLVVDTVIKKAVPKLVAMFIPGAGFISAIISIYDTIMVFVQKLAKIIEVVKGFVDSIVAIASGVIGAAAKRVEGVLAGLLSLAISFLAGFIGLGGIASKIMGVITKIRAPIDKALDALIAWIVGMARQLGKFVAQAGLPKDPNERLELGLAAAATAVNALRGEAVTAPLINPVLGAIKVRYGFKTLQPVEAGGDWWVEGDINPKNKKKTKKRVSAQGQAVATSLVGQLVDSVTQFPPEYRRVKIEGFNEVNRTGSGYSAPELSCDRVGLIKQGRDLLRSDYPLIDDYNAEIVKIVADLGHPLEGNPATLTKGLGDRVQAGRFPEANGIRFQMRRIRDYLRSGDRLNFRGVEVPLGKKRSADYTLEVSDAGVTKRVIVEVKNWSTIRDADDLTDKGARLTAQLSAYVRLAKTQGNNYDAIHLEWKGWTSLDAASRAKFSATINAFKGQATRKGLTLTFQTI